MAHNFTRDPAILDHAANSICPCKDDWLELLEIPSASIIDRMTTGLELLEGVFGR